MKAASPPARPTPVHPSRVLLPAVLVLWALVAIVAAHGAVAQTGDPSTPSPGDLDGVARVLLDGGTYVDPASDVDPAAVGELVSRGREAGMRLMLVVLADDPPGGPTAYADALVDRMQVPGTVVVLTPSSIGWVSVDDTVTDADLERAFRRANEVGGDDLTYLRAFVEELANSGAVTDGDATSSGGGSMSVLVALVVIGALAVGIGWWSRRAGRRAARARVASAFEEARAEIGAQVDAVANDILDLAERVEIAEDPQIKDRYERAAALYGQATERLERATTPEELASVGDALDEAAWHLDAVEALLEGRPPPERPTTSARCFFDPTHRPPFEEAIVEMADGSTESVRVCREDARRLARGRRPPVRTVEVDGERVPSATAPRERGGLGLGIDAWDVLAVVLSGMRTGGVRYDRGRGFPGHRRPSFGSARTRTRTRAGGGLRRSGGGSRSSGRRIRGGGRRR